MDDTKTVLVVDDSRVSRLMARQFILSRHPAWNVVEASTGEDALDMARGMSPVLILIDVNMPGKGGMAAAEQLRASCPGTHISLVTANVQNATRNRTNELGIGFMEKPITEARIHSLIKALGSTTISRQSCRRPCTRRRCRCTLTPPRAPAANACSRRWR